MNVGNMQIRLRWVQLSSSSSRPYIVYSAASNYLFLLRTLLVGYHSYIFILTSKFYIDSADVYTDSADIYGMFKIRFWISEKYLQDVYLNENYWAFLNIKHNNGINGYKL